MANRSALRLDATIGVLAARQRGLVSTSDLDPLGVTPHAARVRRARGQWSRMRRSVVAIAGAPPSFEQVVAAAAMSRGDDVLVAGPTAARLWNMPGRHDAPGINLLTVTPAKARGDGIVTRRTKLLVPADRGEVRKIAVTSYARTLVDISGRNDLSDKVLGWILDDGLRRGTTSLEAVMHTVARLPPGPGRRPTRIRALLAVRGIDFDPGASQPESRLAGWLEAAGLPRPHLDLTVVAGGVEWELDGAFAEAKVCFDYHSEEIHAGEGGIATFHKDARKAAALKNDGWDYSWFTAQSTEAEVVETIGLALRRSAADSVT
jgi:hypothetical protein